MIFRGLLLALFVLLGAPAGFPAAAANENAAWSFTSAVTSHYFFRGVRIAGPSLQPSLDYAAGPFAFGVWSSTALSGRTGDGANPEIDFYTSYAFFNDAGSWGFVPGATLYTHPAADRRDGFHSATFEPFLAFSYTVPLGIRFTPAIHYDFTLQGTTAELTAEFALPLPRLGTELDFAATAGTFKSRSVSAGAAPPVKNWGDYWQAGVTVPVQIGARSRISLAITYAEGRDHFLKQGTTPKQASRDAVGRTSVTLSYTRTL